MKAVERVAVYPINLKIEGKRCLIIGGGKVAFRKARSLLAAGAEVTVLSPKLTEGLFALKKEGRLSVIDDVYRTGCIGRYFLVICATDDAAVNRLAAEEAQQKNILANVIDNEQLSSFVVPASVRRGDVLFTVSTGGKSPALARELRRDLAAAYGEDFARFLQAVENARILLKERLASIGDRENFWLSAINERTIELLKQGNIEKAEAELKNAITCFGIKS
jgi:precorrin-2 dehydrogenase/sirohydrochlorin ferrochelatase